MKKYFWACLMLAFSVQAYADVITGQVVSVSDGDTITVLDNSNTQHKIRLAGIDAPEKRQPFGTASKRSLSDLLYGKQVEVVWQKQDRYGRIVGKVLTGGLDANLEQIKRGMAWFYIRYQKEQAVKDRIDYEEGQNYAEQNQLGLWADKTPTPPWDFRKQTKSN